MLSKMFQHVYMLFIQNVTVLMEFLLLLWPLKDGSGNEKVIAFETLELLVSYLLFWEVNSLNQNIYVLDALKSLHSVFMWHHVMVNY